MPVAHSRDASSASAVGPAAQFRLSFPGHGPADVVHPGGDGETAPGQPALCVLG